MQKISCSFTVYFENPFWVGVYERQEGKKLSVCKIVFGAEPKGYEIHKFLLNDWNNLIFSLPIKNAGVLKQKQNPKRIQREISRQLLSKGTSTKSQMALKEQQEQKKVAHKKRTRVEKEIEKENQFRIRKQKKKEKHRGK